MMQQSHLQMPGATLMTRLKVYDTPTPDEQIGGTPHVHLVCTEMYIVLNGSGAVEMLDKDGFSRVELQQNDALLFSPGTIHRLINPNCDLELLVIMQNSGLPERGDNVVTFTDNYLMTDEAYTEAMQVQTIEDAYQRRNRGVDGFLGIKAAFEDNLSVGQAALEKFYAYANARTASQQQQWHKIIHKGALSTAKESLAQIEQLQAQNTRYLSNNAHTVIRADDFSNLGFCGHLNRYFDPATLLLEGQEI